MAREIGSTVYLKSGGPAMTVDQVMDGTVSCKWFNGGTACRENFPDAALTDADPTEELEMAAALRAVKVRAATAEAEKAQP